MVGWQRGRDVRILERLHVDGIGEVDGDGGVGRGIRWVLRVDLRDAERDGR